MCREILVCVVHILVLMRMFWTVNSGDNSSWFPALHFGLRNCSHDSFISCAFDGWKWCKSFPSTSIPFVLLLHFVLYYYVWWNCLILPNLSTEEEWRNFLFCLYIVFLFFVLYILFWRTICWNEPCGSHREGKMLILKVKLPHGLF